MKFSYTIAQCGKLNTLEESKKVMAAWARDSVTSKEKTSFFFNKTFIIVFLVNEKMSWGIDILQSYIENDSRT